MGSLAFILMTTLVSAAPIDDETRPRIAILDLDVERESDRELSPLIGALLAERVARIGAFFVITQDDIRRLVSFDRMKVALSCDDDASCLSELGDALGARYLITGSLGRLDTSLVLALSVIDLENVKTVGRETLTAVNASAMSADLDAVLGRLLRTILLDWRGTLVIESEQTGASVFVDDRAVGITPLPPMELPAGPHRVVVSREGYVSFLRDVDVPPKARANIDVNLAPLPETHDALFRNALLTLGAGTTLVVVGTAAMLAVGVGGLFFAESTKLSTGKPVSSDGGPFGPVLVPEESVPLILGGRVAGAVGFLVGTALIVGGAACFPFVDFPDDAATSNSPAPSSTAHESTRDEVSE